MFGTLFDKESICVFDHFTILLGGWLLYKYVLRKVQEIRDEEEKQYRILFRQDYLFLSCSASSIICFYTSIISLLRLFVFLLKQTL